MKRPLLLPLLASAFILSASGIAQAPVGQAPAAQPGKYGQMFFKTNVGSFKILGPGDDKAEGTIRIACHGTILIAGLEGTVTPVNMRREINDPSIDRQVYFGNGVLTIRGKWTAIQFFGRNLDAQWNGFGIIRLYGEFDRDLNTGDFWYGSDPTRRPWGNGGLTVTNPQSRAGGGAPSPDQSRPRPRIQDK